MSKTTDILKEYTDGTSSLEQTNVALKEANAGFHLDPNKHYLSPDEIMTGSAGLLDTGTGTLDKVKIEGDELVNCDCGEMVAFVTVQGHTFKVEGKKIIR